jgi:hypothetical protein
LQLPDNIRCAPTVQQCRENNFSKKSVALRTVGKIAGMLLVLSVKAVEAGRQKRKERFLRAKRFFCRKFYLTYHMLGLKSGLQRYMVFDKQFFGAGKASCEMPFLQRGQ